MIDQKKQRNPPWRFEELVLAMELYVRRGIVAKTDPEVEELSHVLNALGRGRGNALFRNANGVHMKLGNFRAHDSKGGGLQHGNRLEEVVWKKFHGRPDLLATEAAAIKRGLPTAR